MTMQYCLHPEHIHDGVAPQNKKGNPGSPAE